MATKPPPKYVDQLPLRKTESHLSRAQRIQLRTHMEELERLRVELTRENEPPRPGRPLRGHLIRLPLRIPLEAHLHPLIREAAETDELSLTEWLSRAILARLRKQGFTNEELDDSNSTPTGPERPEPPAVEGRKVIK